MSKQVACYFFLLVVIVMPQQSVAARNGVRVVYTADDLLMDSEDSQEQDFSDWYAGYKVQQAEPATPQIVAIVQRPIGEKSSSDRDRDYKRDSYDRRDRDRNRDRDRDKNRDKDRDKDRKKNRIDDDDDDVDRLDDYRRDRYKDSDYDRYREDDDRLRDGGYGGGGCCDSGFDFTIILALISVGLLYILFLYLTVNSVNGRKRKRSFFLSNDISDISDESE